MDPLVFLYVYNIYVCAYVCMCQVIEKYFLLIYWICIVLLQTNLNEYMYMCTWMYMYQVPVLYDSI